MGRHAFRSFEEPGGDAPPARGRTVVGLGIALGLIVGLTTWVLSGGAGQREPLSAGQPAQLPPPDIMAPTLDGPTPVGTDAIGAAPAEALQYSSPVAGWSPPAAGGPSSAGAGLPGPAVRPDDPVVTGPLSASYTTRTIWDSGLVADVVVTNRSATTQGFLVRLDLPAGVRLTGQVWNATPDRDSGSVTFRGGPVAPGQQITFGYVAEKSRAVQDPARLRPTACTVNGAACEGFAGSGTRAGVTGVGLRASGGG